MSVKVTNLTIRAQTGSEDTLYATWNFTPPKSKGSSGGVRKGDLVSIKSGATYYNGVAIPSWVQNQRWYVLEVNGDRAVLDENESKTNHIKSPVNVNNLIGGSGSSAGSSDTLDHYSYTWFYDTGDGVWFIEGNKSTNGDETAQKMILYNLPSNAIRVHLHIIPVSKTYKVNDKDTSYWQGDLTIAEYRVPVEIEDPEVPPVPKLEYENGRIIATVDNVTDPNTEQIYFMVYGGSAGTDYREGGFVNVVACKASYSFTSTPGNLYRVRCYARRTVGGTIYDSEMTDFSDGFTAVPASPTSLGASATSSTSIRLRWSPAIGVDTYELEYTTERRYFDTSGEVTSVSDIKGTTYEVTGLESGDEYYFRVRAINDQGDSGWSNITSLVIGRAPAAPTTWSTTTTAITGENVNLYWVHNSEDGSREQYAQVEITVNGTKNTYTIKNPDAENEEEDETARYYTLNTGSYSEGAKISWRVRTSGITLDYGDWSIMRVIDVYAPPSLALTVTNRAGSSLSTITSYPFFIKGTTSPNTQTPVGYSVVIKANTSYQTVNYQGETVTVKAGDEVYNAFVNTSQQLLLELSAQDVNLDSSQSYTVVCVVSMNSGLTAQATATISVSWTETEVAPNYEISVDDDSYAAYIIPYVRNDDGVPISGYWLSLYRREYDGNLTEIATGIDSSRNTSVTDPHPSLDYARYRVIAISKTTGAVSYYDAPGYPVHGISIIIQWDEEWTDFDVNNTALRVEPQWSGSLLKLPYNIDVSSDVAPDAELVNYVGRTYPTSYYGSSVSSTASWKTDIPATDTETLYALRRLQVWRGDCYVREPSGSGYWANLQVSFEQTHLELVIPVTLTLTRVTGGI